MVLKPKAKELLQKHNRRQFLKNIGLSTAAGAAAGIGAKVGLDYIANNLIAGIAEAEKQLRETAVDIRALIGTVEKKLAYQTDLLEKHLNSNILKKYEELGIAEPADIKQFEQIIQNSREFEEYYSFAERAKIFKDRIDRRILSLDDKLESMQPGFMQKFNDMIREFYGKKSAAEIREHNKNIRERLESLCKIYDTNDNNKIAQTEVLTKLNEYLSASNEMKISPEERELYLILKQECEKNNNSQAVRDFIRQHNHYDARTETLVRLRTHLSEAENLYAKIKENKEYVIKLQTLLKDGISQVEKVRTTSEQDFKRQKQEITDKVNELKTTVDNTIQELKKKGYDIETREDYINSGTIAANVRKGLMPQTSIGALITGLGAAVLTFLYTRKNSQYKAAKNALNEAVSQGEQNAS